MRSYNTARQLGLAAFLAAALAAPPATAGLLVRQHSNGLPGMQRSEVVPQLLRVGEGAMRLDDRRPGGRYVIVRLREEVFWEVDPELRMYVEQSFAAIRRKREQAERDREDARQLALERLRGEELEQWLRAKGLRADGKRIVTTAWLGPERVGPYRTEHVRIALNDKPVIDLWVTGDIEEYSPPPELFELYERCGLFPDDITRALREVEGFPVRVHADLDFFTQGTTLRTEVESVHAWPEEPAVFEVPEGFRRVERFPPRTAGAAPVRCAHCGAEIAEPRERVPGSGEFVCSKRCLLEYIRGLRSGASAGSGAGADGERAPGAE
ncbi:MAG: hypothetical protein KatS3mg102_0853 [Planctomycetota bacterium]|nr:MAG: hypothetical protein KatS3mg102_0853 [Planctomycetota bacterium]